ncbi:DUF4446 family protein [Tepidimicrobium xylanilyticum]|uniref:DUF4446 domain-containing protein n=1 Tax=Tepidimicrobium xylanilyticum TaxID=1123352 RepID=A0A1H3AM58_9FIRM|nr:DUF4446 family protein [Tepidimicrobium xylanilyticum]GMG98082.1 hypothetical protein EN5CB1_29080 [Tepidimicrobium xylanilyticum]SDX29919.1 Protein of unknown function [Tepidimicrobium xylanilyticum]
MEQVRQIIELYYAEITIGTLVAFFILLALYLIAEIRISKIKNRYNQLVRGMDGVSIEELLIENGNKMVKLEEDFSQLFSKVNSLDGKFAFSIQKIGYIRYDAFGDMGSELSFSIALLDEFLNGFVLTSIYGREHSTCYAKPIKDGKSPYPLSVEEMQAIDRAIKGENINY